MTKDRPRIAILGWGSLLWEPHDFDGLHEEWRLDGPAIKLEFSRISWSRQGALTLVIDETHGRLNKVAYSISKSSDLDKVIHELQRREGTTTDQIAAWSEHDGYKGPDSNARATIRDWAIGKGIASVVWTGLPSNFKPPPFSPDAAILHLQTLGACGKVRAAEYIWRAPPQVRTDLRDKVEVQPWFQQKRS